MFLAYGYAAAGGLVALAFVLWGAGRIDPAARGAWAARVMWMPGLLLLWPVVLVRWIMLERQAR
jgi:hypothetical protein